MSKEGSGGVQLAPARVGKYLMLDLLGEGAFGKVRVAVDETDGQQYAIKIMEKSHIRANELTVQVRREIAVMKAMRHRELLLTLFLYELPTEFQSHETIKNH